MIVGFADEATRDVYDGNDTKAARRIPATVWAAARRKLDMLNAARAAKDLRCPPGNRLERLRGDLAGNYSIRINDQYRVVFAFEDGNAKDVRIADYHR